MIPALFRGETVACETGLCAPRRRDEFAAGRSCAARALSRFGVEAPVGSGVDRSPLWPPGFTGSISHKEGLCAAAVAPVGRILGIGLDIETCDPLDDCLRLVLAPPEIERMRDLPEGRRGLLAKALFSAKESLYKCVRPFSDRFIDFREVVVDLDPDRSRFRAALPPDVVSRLPAGCVPSGRILFAEPWVLTGTLLLRSV